MSNINLFANALDGWLAEWKEKRQSTSGLSTNRPAGTECEGGAGHAAIKAPCETSSAGIYQGNSEPIASTGMGYVGEDGGYIPDWRDAEGLTDVLPEMEMWRDKGAGK